MSPKKRRVPHEVRDGNLLVAQINSWQQRPTPHEEEKPREDLEIFLSITIGKGPGIWTIGWVQAFSDENSHAGRIQTIRKKGRVPVSLTDGDVITPMPVKQITTKILRELALAHAAGISLEATQLAQRRARRHKTAELAWDLDSTREKLKEAKVDIERLA